MKIGIPRRYICPKCGAKVIVSEGYDLVGAKLTEYKCIKCKYCRRVAPVESATKGGAWVRTKDEDLPIVAPIYNEEGHSNEDEEER